MTASGLPDCRPRAAKAASPADLPAEGPAGKSEESSASSFRGDAEDLLFGAGSAKAGALFWTPGIILFSISEELQKKRIICCIDGKKQV